MRKLLIVILIFTVLFTHSEKAEASFIKQNKSATADNITLTEDYLEGTWGNKNGFVCEFHYGDFIGFSKKTSTYLETYNYRIIKNAIHLTEAGTFVAKLPVKFINKDCIMINGIKAYRAGSKEADQCQKELRKAFLGEWFDCDLSDYLYDKQWQFTNDMATHSYTVPSEDGKLEKIENPYYIYNFQFCSSDGFDPFYICYTKDELKLYQSCLEMHLLRMNSTKLKGFLQGDNIFSGKYIVKDSLYREELTEVNFVDDPTNTINENDPKKLVDECKFNWDGHEMTMSVGGETYKVYLYGQQRTLVLGNLRLELVPENYQEVREYKRIKKLQAKNGKVELRNYINCNKEQDAIKYLKLSFRYKNNVFLNDAAYIYTERDDTPLYPTGTVGSSYIIRTKLDLSNAKLTLAYRPDYLPYKCEDDLAIAYVNKSGGTAKILESTVNSKDHTVSTVYCGQGYYQLIDRVLVKGQTHDISQFNLRGNIWAQKLETGDILKLVDLKYLQSSEGHFKVSNASELATAVFYANTQNPKAVIELTNDIDLSQYEWSAIGWNSFYYNDRLPFQGEIIGNHHKITGLTMHSTNYSVGFVGFTEDCTISDLTIEDADISAIHSAAILVAYADRGRFKNCNVSGRVIGSSAGSMFAFEEGSIIKDCTANVIVNSKEFSYLSISAQQRNKYMVKDPIRLTIDDDHVVKGTDNTKDKYMRWIVYLDEHRIVEQEVEGNLEYKCDTSKKGEYIIYLEGLIDDYYIPFSNKITFTIK